MKDNDHSKIEKRRPSSVPRKSRATTGKQKEYDHVKIEKKWQKEWSKKKAYKADDTSKKPKQYVLDMFPYPSGTGLHVGHPKGYIGSDVYARMKHMQGFNVLHPMGYDAFGLPAEQYAIQHKISPAKAVAENIKTFEKQLSIIGLSYDWERKVNTTDPKFYKWTQWIFLKLYNSWYNLETDKAEPIETLIKKFANEKTDGKDKEEGNWNSKSELEKQSELMKYRLAYEGYAEVNWCPELGTVLANDEVVDDKDGKPVSERGGFPVEKRSMRQWFLRITVYAEKLLLGLEKIDWPEHIKEIERNWIGRSLGAEIGFNIVDSRKQIVAGKEEAEKIRVFTTRPDTLFGVTYLVISPEHALLSKIKDQKLEIKIENWEEVKKYIEKILDAPGSVKGFDDAKQKTGVELKGVKAVNPANGEEVPVWVADYVLASYGTGAVMAVPAHDERDFEFAKKYGLPVRKVLTSEEELFIGYSTLINSGKFDGMDSETAKKAITEFVGGKMVTKYKMRDAIFARQRYWGEPIPLFRDTEGVIHEVPESTLPLKLPKVISYEPTGMGQGPLAKVTAWVKKGYETNTMPGWAGSSWYFLRYMDPKNKKVFADRKKIDYWQDVDMYVGGAEHATGHLLYARFWHKFLFDLGLVPTDEPFKSLRNQGLILGGDNRKMSKRWGNVVNPDDIVMTYGADTLRVYEMFMGPFEASLPWSTENIIGSRRFVEKVWRLAMKVSKVPFDSTFDTRLETLIHKTIQKVSDDIEHFAFNTAISAMMILVNEMEKSDATAQKDFEMFLKILTPFAPHVAEEIWHALGHKTLIVSETWPKVDAEKMKESQVKIVVQVNGKVRGEIIVALDTVESEIVTVAQALPAVDKWLLGNEIKKVVYVPLRLVNFVV